MIFLVILGLKNWKKKMKDEIKDLTIEEKLFENSISNKTKDFFQKKINELENVIKDKKVQKIEYDTNLKNYNSKLKKKLLDISFPIKELKANESYTIKALRKDLSLMKKKYENLKVKQNTITNKISEYNIDIVSCEDNELYKKFSPFYQKQNDFTNWCEYKEEYLINGNIDEKKNRLQMLEKEYINSTLKIKNYDENCIWRDKFSYEESLKEIELDIDNINFSIIDLEGNMKIFIKETEKMEKRYSDIMKEYKEFDHEEYNKNYNSLQKLENDLNMNIVQMDISVEKLNDANNIEFNLKCESCKKNPYYCEKIKFEKEIKALKKKQTLIKKNIQKSEKYFKDYIDLKSNSIMKDINNFVLKQIKLQKELLDIKNMINVLTKMKIKIENTIQYMLNTKMNSRISNIREEQEKLNSDIKNYYVYLDNKNIFDIIDKEYFLYEKLDNQRILESDKKKIDSEINILEKNIFMLENGLAEKEKSWNYNKKVFNEIQKIEVDIDECELRKRNLLLERNVIELDLLENEFQKWYENYNLWKEKKMELLLKTNILKIIDKDGLPFILLTNKMSMIERNINELIEPFINTKIKFDVDKKNIDVGTVTQLDGVYSHYDGGMQKFIINLCFKMIFAKYSLIPKSNFFIIDEGISVLDKKHLHDINYLLSFLSTLTTNIFLISHIPQIRDFVNLTIMIEKKKYSKLKI